MFDSLKDMILTDRDITLLPDGKTAFSRILENMRSARHTLFLRMFIWRDDRIGNKIAKAMLDAADRGVLIHVVKDRLGVVFEKAEEGKQSLLHKNSSPLLDLRAALIDRMYPMTGKARRAVQRANPLGEALMRHPNIRIECTDIRSDHSKCWIFDGRVLILGGMNIEDKEVDCDVSGRAYTDYMAEIRGVAAVQRFLAACSGNGLVEAPSGRDGLSFFGNFDSPAGRIFGAKSAMRALIDGAEHSIDVLMAYLGDRQIADALVARANAGVSVRLLLPERANLQQDLNLREAGRMTRASGGRVKVLLSPNMVHAKLVHVDSHTVAFGSVNLNRQAMSSLAELNVQIRYAPGAFGNALAESIRREFSIARPVEEKEALRHNRLRAFLEGLV